MRYCSHLASVRRNPGTTGLLRGRHEVREAGCRQRHLDGVGLVRADQRVGELRAVAVDHLPLEHALCGERMSLELVRPTGRSVLGNRVPVPVIDAQHLDHVHTELEQPAGEHLGLSSRNLDVVGVEQDRCAAYPVGERGVDQHVSHLPLLARLEGQVDPGMERRAGWAERQQHDGVLGMEAQDRGHDGDQVGGVAGDEGGGVRCSHAQRVHPPARRSSPASGSDPPVRNPRDARGCVREQDDHEAQQHHSPPADHVQHPVVTGPEHDDGRDDGVHPAEQPPRGAGVALEDHGHPEGPSRHAAKAALPTGW